MAYNRRVKAMPRLLTSNAGVSRSSRQMVRPGSKPVLLLAVATARLALGFRGMPAPLGPRGTIGAMTLVRGSEFEADGELWGGYCDPFTPTPGRYRRTCRVVPRIHRLFIGYGDLEATMKASASAWKQLKWQMWIDGHPIDLPSFGTDVRKLYNVQGGGKNEFLREWSVILTGATPGTHLIRIEARAPPGQSMPPGRSPSGPDWDPRSVWRRVGRRLSRV